VLAADATATRKNSSKLLAVIHTAEVFAQSRTFAGDAAIALCFPG
jgi:hypothetical protein